MQCTALIGGRGGAATALSGHRLNSSRPIAMAPCARPGWQAASSMISRRGAAMESRNMQLAEDSAQEPSVEFLGVVNDMQTARGFITTTQAEPDLVYQILSDYDSCPRVFRSVARSETVETPQGVKQVLQAGKWQFLFFKGTFDVRLNVVEVPEDKTIVFTLAESTFMRNFEGRWQLAPLAGGGTRAEYLLSVQPLLPIPAAVAPYTGGIFKKQVADLLEDVQAELSRQAQARRWRA